MEEWRMDGRKEKQEKEGRKGGERGEKGGRKGGERGEKGGRKGGERREGREGRDERREEGRKGGKRGEKEGRKGGVDKAGEGIIAMVMSTQTYRMCGHESISGINITMHWLRLVQHG